MTLVPRSLLALCLASTLSVAAPSAAQDGLEPARPARRVVVVTTATGGPFVERLRRLGCFDLHAVAPERCDRGVLARADVLVLVDAGDRTDALLGPTEPSRSPRRGLIVVGPALETLARTARGAQAIGCAPPDAAKAAPKATADEATAVAVQVVDQRHAITQCVTHFVHRCVPARPQLERRAQVLARASGPMPRSAQRGAGAGAGAGADNRRELPAALWTFSGPRGRVIATTLDPHGGKSADLVATIVLRAAQWSLGDAITVPIAGDLQLAADGLGSDDSGLLPGVAPLPGFYRGRQIAGVMSFHGAPWLVRPDRETTERPDRVVESLGLREGQTVADVGAGNGYFALRLARAVGARGKVLAVDIQKEMLDLLRDRAAKAGVGNIVPVLATETDPRLEPNSIDLALFVDVYHELARPAPVMQAIRRALRRDGRVVLVEYRGEDPRVPIKPLHRMTVRQARAEMRALGFRFLETKSFLPRQHVLVFGRDTDGADLRDEQKPPPTEREPRP